MKPSYDMELFLTAVLKGAHATRQRHLNQARLIQAAIQQRWQLDNPRRWQLKHLQWLMREHLAEHSPHSRYYYGLTVKLIVRRLGKEKDWRNVFHSIGVRAGNRRRKPEISLRSLSS
jgi:hypothetical protein